MRSSFHFGASLLSFSFFLFSILEPPIACAQSSAAASSGVPATAQRIALAGVPNAGKINNFLLRGAQPSNQGLAELKKLGVTAIVSLRSWSHEVESERKPAESLGFLFLNIPVGGGSLPRGQHVAQCLALFREPSGQRIFVHSKFGDDRPGVMVAAYRIAENHWSGQQAIREIYFFGFHYHRHPAMESFVRNFPANYASDPAFAPVRNPGVEQ